MVSNEKHLKTFPESWGESASLIITQVLSEFLAVPKLFRWLSCPNKVLMKASLLKTMI